MNSLIDRSLRTAFSVVCSLLIVVTSATAAEGTTHAAGQDQMTAYLAAHPGGRPINDNQISYGDGTFIVTLRPPSGTQGMPDCPANWYCFYERVSYGYPRGQLSACAKQYLGKWGWQFRAESAHYNLMTGYAVFYYYDVAMFYVGIDKRADDDVSPYRNMANYVRRFC